MPRMSEWGCVCATLLYTYNIGQVDMSNVKPFHVCVCVDVCGWIIAADMKLYLEYEFFSFSTDPDI